MAEVTASRGFKRRPPAKGAGPKLTLKFKREKTKLEIGESTQSQHRTKLSL